MINIGIHKVKLVDTTGLFEFLLWCRKVVQCSARPEVVLLENIPWASTKTHKTLKLVVFFFHLSVPAPHTVHKNDGNKKRPASDQQCDDT